MQLLFDPLAFHTQRLDLFVLRFVLAALAFQFVQYVFHMHMLLVQQLARIFDYRLGQSQTAADIKSVTAAGNTHQQPVGRPQADRVKFHTGVFHTCVPVCKGFQFAVVRSYHRQCAQLVQMLQHRHRQGSAFVRVSTGTYLIYQHQIAAADFV